MPDRPREVGLGELLEALHDLLERPAIGRRHPGLRRLRLRVAPRPLRIANDRTIAGSSPSRSPSTSAVAARSGIPLGHEPTPSFHAASIMFCAARPASNDVGPLPWTAIATAS